MPEGDTIRWRAAHAPGPGGPVADIRAHPPALCRRMAGWQRLTGRTVERVDTYGKHLLLRFEGDLVLHSHLGMVGSWGVYAPGRRWPRSPRRAWLVMRMEAASTWCSSTAPRSS